MLRRIRRAYLKLRGIKTPGKSPLSSLPNANLFPVFNRLNGEELARMSTVSRRYRNFIRNHPTLSRKVDVARRKAISRRRVQQKIQELHGTWMELNNANKRAIMNRIMALPNNHHPVTNQTLFNVFWSEFH